MIDEVARATWWVCDMGARRGCTSNMVVGGVTWAGMHTWQGHG